MTRSYNPRGRNPRTVWVTAMRDIKRSLGDQLAVWAGHYATNTYQDGRPRRRVGTELPEHNTDRLFSLETALDTVIYQATTMRAQVRERRMRIEGTWDDATR